ncbi:hypothetical protein [Brucella anthropi]|uniref:hypothetical protein n=1 Tax=Brucella anthropi TaxID=529 RepID=UPI0004EDA790|nr:hypothetical protein [Brucella anthropi]AIK40847.1 hypothetical protein DR92_4446 [Brucella anthropi]
MIAKAIITRMGRDGFAGSVSKANRARSRQRFVLNYILLGLSSLKDGNETMSEEQKIRGPRKLGDYPDRDIHCQEALEDAFIALTDRGVDAGWVQIEVLQALHELAKNHLMRDFATEVDEDNIATVIRSMRHDKKD